MRLTSTNAQYSKAISAIAAPAKPTSAMDAYVHTPPPMKLPVPIPKLKMPEKMAMATVCSPSDENSMISAWYTML